MGIATGRSMRDGSPLSPNRRRAPWGLRLSAALVARASAKLPIGGEPHGDCDGKITVPEGGDRTPNRRRAPWGLRLDFSTVLLMFYLPIGGEPHGDCDITTLGALRRNSPNRRRAPWGLRQMGVTHNALLRSPNRRRAPWGLRRLQVWLKATLTFQ